MAYGSNPTLRKFDGRCKAHGYLKPEEIRTDIDTRGTPRCIYCSTQIRLKPKRTEQAKRRWAQKQKEYKSKNVPMSVSVPIICTGNNL